MSEIRYPQPGEIWKGSKALALILKAESGVVQHETLYNRGGPTALDELDEFMKTHRYYYPINLDKKRDRHGYGLIPDYHMGLNYFLDTVDRSITKNASSETIPLPEEMYHFIRYLVSDERHGDVDSKDKIYVNEVGRFTLENREFIIYIVVNEYVDTGPNENHRIDNFGVKLLVTDSTYTHAHTSYLSSFIFAERTGDKDGSCLSVVDGSRRCIFSDHYKNIKQATIRTVRNLAVRDLHMKDPKKSPYMVWYAGIVNNVKYDHRNKIDLDKHIDYVRRIDSL